MKSIIFLFIVSISISLNAQISKTVTLLSAGTLSSNIPQSELSTITNLTINGKIDARDFKTMRDQMPSLTDVILLNANIIAYSGTLGTNGNLSQLYPENTIPAKAFENKNALKSIQLPVNILSVDNYAFSSTGLEAINLPSSLTAMGDYVFNNTLIKNITLPASLQKIGSTNESQGFGANYCLNSIIVESSNLKFSSVDGILYNKQQDSLLYCPQGKAGNISLVKTTKVIREQAFENCVTLTSIAIPQSVITIQDKAFSWCRNLQYLILPSTLEVIGNYAFNTCESLRFIRVLGTTPIDISKNLAVFENVNKTTPLYVPELTKSKFTNSNQWNSFTNIIEINDSHTVSIPGALANIVTELNTVTTITIVGQIDARDFKSLRDLMPNIAHIDLKNASITEYSGTSGTAGDNYRLYPANTIPACAFYNLNNIDGNLSLNTIILPKTATEIADSAFYACKNLAEIQLQYELKTIRAAAFYKCNMLKDIEFPSSLLEVNSNLFGDENHLKYIRSNNPAPPKLSLIYNNESFKGIDKTIPLYIPKGSSALYKSADGWKDFLNISEIDSNAIFIFCSAGKLSSLLGKNVNANAITIIGEIDARDFKTMRDSMPNLKMVNLLASNIAAYAGVEGTSPTQTIYNPNTIPMFSFYNGTNGKDLLSSIILPKNATTIGSAAFKDCFRLNSVSLPESLTTIDNSAFKNTALGNVTIPKSVTTIGNYVFSSPLSLKVAWSAPINISSSVSLCSSYKNLYVPAGTANLYKNAAVWKNFTILSPFEVSPQILSLSSNEKTSIIDVITNLSWAVTISESWLTIDKHSGQGSESIILSCSNNNLSVPRSAYLTFTTDSTEPQTIQITQEAGPNTLALSNTELVFDKIGNSATINVISNTNWTIENANSWITVTSPLGQIGNGEIFITVSPNPTAFARTAMISVSAKGVDTKTILVSQAANPYFSLSTSSVILEKLTTKPIVLNISSNTKWEATVNSNWLVIEPSTGDGNASVSVYAKTNNPLATNRTNEISFTANEISDKAIVSVVQNANPYLTASTTSLSIADSAQSFSSFYIAANYSWSITPSVDWLVVDRKQITSDTSLIIITATSRNTNLSERNATLKITDSLGISQDITLTQAAAQPFLSIDANILSIENTINSNVSTHVTTNTIWQVVSPVNWLSVKKDIHDSIIITATEINFSIKPRSTNLVISADGIGQQIITVTQKANEPMLQTINTISMPKYANSSIDVSVLSNVGWSAKSSASWITITMLDTVNGYFSISTNEANPTVSPRNASIIISTNGLTADKTITITQQAGDPQFSVAPFNNLTNERNSSINISVTSNTSWSIISHDDWLQLDAMDTVLGNGQITIHALTDNISLQNRSGSIIVSISGLPNKTINIIQDAGTPFISAPLTAELSKIEGSKVNLAISSNTAWSASTSEAWITVGTGSVGNGILEITALAANPTTIERSAIIRLFAANAKDQTITVTQAAGDPILKLSANSGIIGKAAASSISFVITSNINYSLTSNVDWLTTATKQTTDNQTYLTISASAENLSTTERLGEITLSGIGVQSQTISITQLASEASFSSSTNIVNLDNSADYSQQVTISSNTSWSATTDATWLQLETSPNSLTVKSISANESIHERTANVIITATNGPTINLLVIQNASLPSINCAENTIDVANIVNEVHTVAITSNTSWTASSTDSWFSIATSKNPNGGIVSITVLKENPTTEPRTGFIKLSANGVQSEILLQINQTAGSPKLDVIREVTIGKLISDQTNIEVNSNVKWKAITLSSWLKISSTVNTPENGIISVSSFNDNPTIISRKAYITITSNEFEPINIEVTQTPGDTVLSASVASKSLRSIGDTLSVLVNSNTGWLISSNASWLRPSVSHDSSDATFSVFAQANPSTEKRNATLTITASNTSPIYLFFSQSGDTILHVEQKALNFFADTALSITIPVINNISWTALASEKWITLTQFKDSLKIAVNPNFSLDKRSGLVSISALGAQEKIIAIKQVGADTLLSVSQTSMLISAAADTSTLSISSNVNWYCTTDVNWIKTSAISTIGNTTLPLIFEANSDTTVRYATVSVLASASLIKKIVIIQKGLDTKIETAFLTVSRNLIRINTSDTIVNALVTSNKSWNATSDANWLKVALSGTDFTAASSTVALSSASKTTSELWFIAQKNSSQYPRIAHVSIETDSGTSQEIIIEQAPSLPILQVSTNEIIMQPTDSVASITVTANGNWSANSNADWLSVSLSEYDNNSNASINFSTQSKTTTQVWFRAASNTTTIPRNATVTISSGSLSPQKITLTQNATALAPFLYVSKNDVTISSQQYASIIDISVQSNISWTCHSTASWLNFSVISTSQIKIFTAETNKQSEARSAELLFIAPTIDTVRITVHQAAALTYLEISAKELHTIARADTLALQVKSNTKWLASCNDKWLTTKIINDSLYIFTTENTTINKRIATITISSDSISSQTIQIIQSEGEAYILAQQTINALFTDNKMNIAIKSNTEWTANCLATWVTIESPTNIGNSDLILNLQANPFNYPRSTSILLTAANTKAQLVTIIQSANENTTVNSPSNDVIKIYPNPTSDGFILQTNDVVHVTIISNGIELYSKSVLPNEMIDISHLPKGSYQVYIHENKHTYTLIKL